MKGEIHMEHQLWLKKDNLKKRLVVVLVLALAVGVAQTTMVGATKKGFQQKKLTKTIKKRITGKSYPKKDAKISYGELRYLKVRYYDFKGKKRNGELIVNRRIAKRPLTIFRKLYKMKYRIQRIKLVDAYGADDEKSMSANNTSAFNYRVIKGTNRLSKHSYGMAIDINPRINPCVSAAGIEPANGKKYVNRKWKGKYSKYMIHKNSKIVKLFKNWPEKKDYQHFEVSM